MFAEFRCHPNPILSMSNNSELLLVKDSEEGLEFSILKRPPTLMEFQEEEEDSSSSSSSSSSHDVPVHDHKQRQLVLQEEDHEEKEGTESNVKEREKKIISLGELKEPDDDDDGFKTPTSEEQKIPVITECPPAPRKPKPPPLRKRKLARPSTSSSMMTSRWNTINLLQRRPLDLSQEVESLFPRPILADLHRKVKKSRAADEEDDKFDQ